MIPRSKMLGVLYVVMILNTSIFVATAHGSLFHAWRTGFLSWFGRFSHGMTYRIPVWWAALGEFYHLAVVVYFKTRSVLIGSILRFMAIASAGGDSWAVLRTKFVRNNALQDDRAATINLLDLIGACPLG
jgi:hypothetical protein